MDMETRRAELAFFSILVAGMTSSTIFMQYGEEPQEPFCPLFFNWLRSKLNAQARKDLDAAMALYKIKVGLLSMRLTAGAIEDEEDDDADEE